jgi:hypothetical protein
MRDSEAQKACARLIGILAELINYEVLNGFGREPMKASGNMARTEASLRSPMAAFEKRHGV